MDVDDYHILNLDEQVLSSFQSPAAPQLAFEDLDFDEGEPEDFKFDAPLVDDTEFDDESPGKEEMDYDRIVEHYEENDFLGSEDEEEDRPAPKFVIPKKTNTKMPASKLDEELKNVLAHARILKAEQKYAEGIKTCLGLIKLAPTAHEVYVLLANLYELTGSVKEAEQIKQVAELIAPTSREVIEKKLKDALAEENYHVASILYGQLSRMDVNNLKLHQEYIRTLKLIGAEKRVLLAQSHMIRGMKDPALAEQARELAVATAFEMMRMNLCLKAKTCLENLVWVHPDEADESFVNLLTEIYVKVEDYEAILLCLIVKCGVRALDSQGNDVVKVDDFPSIVDCVVPEDMAVELKSKLAIALVGLGHPQLAVPLEELLMQYRADYADAIVDIASTHRKTESYERGQALLDDILSWEGQDTGENWKLLGECYEGSGQLEKAAGAYQTAIRKTDDNAAVRMQLAGLLERNGEIRGAIEALTPDKGAQFIETNTQYELCLLCERHMNLPGPNGEYEFMEDFINAVRTLFTRHSHTIKSRNEFESFFSTSRTMYIESAILNEGIRGTRTCQFTKPNHRAADEYRLFDKTYEILFEQRRYPELQRLVFQSILSFFLTRGGRYSKQLWAKAFVSSYLNKDSFALFGRARILVDNADRNIAWNLYNMAVHRCMDFRHTKSLARFTAKNPDCLAALIMTGNNSLLAGSYKYAINEYMQAFKINPNDPLILLCIGCAFIHLACQKFSDRKSSIIVQAMSFFKAYKEIRGEGQETYYNIGRAYHQVGLFSQALHNYRAALEQKPWLASYDLTREIAVNIVTIYKHSGARDLALHYIKKYLTY